MLCTSCGVLVGVNDPTCYNCGRRNPGLWGFAPALRALGNDLGFVNIVTGGTIIMYVLSLVMSRDRAAASGFSPNGDALHHPRRERLRARCSRRGWWWTVLTAGWLHGGAAAHLLQRPVDPSARSRDRQPVWRRAHGDHLHRSPASSGSRSAQRARLVVDSVLRRQARRSARRRRSSASSARSCTTAGAPAAATPGQMRPAVRALHGHHGLRVPRRRQRRPPWRLYRRLPRRR